MIHRVISPEKPTRSPLWIEESTMAETVISAIIGDVVSRVISHLLGPDTDRHQQSTETKLQMICHKLVRIHSVVEEARGKQVINDGTLQWLSELIDAEYQGKYLLDGIKHELEGEDDDDSKVVPQVSTFSFLFNPAKRVQVSVRSLLSRRHDLITDEIYRVLGRLQSVCDGLREFIMLLQSCKPMIHRPLATNIFRDGQMFGRHVEKERIINFLLQDGMDHQIGVLPVVGDTGVGKTTLVQYACDDARVRSHFQVIMLLNFSCTTSATAIRSERTFVLRSKHVIGDAGIVDVNDPVELVEWDFGNKRFLMVFEDVDMLQKQVLEELLLPRMRCTAGSKIIITTNNRLVTTIGTVKPIILKVLPFPEYWFFFKAHAFLGRDLEESPTLVAAGKAMAKKLNGSFFGAKIAGGLLRNNPNPSFWCKVSSSNIENMSMLGDGIDYIMGLSQKFLPRNIYMSQVIISKDQFSLTQLTRFHGVSAAQITSWAQDYGFARVLLCRSLLPFDNSYYIADYIVDPMADLYSLDRKKDATLGCVPVKLTQV